MKECAQKPVASDVSHARMKEFRREDHMMEQAGVLYLDFDGVLHPFGEAELDENYQLINNPLLFCWRPILEDILSPHPCVKIIVSSDWRRLFDDTNLLRLLGSRLGPRFIGVVETYRASRAEEIYADALRRDLRCWLALDDHPTGIKARQAGEVRFVACASETGLSNPLVQQELRRKLA